MSKKHIREYVYIDNIELNSVLAQLKDGIPTVIKKVNQTTSESKNTIGKENNYRAEGGAKFFLEGQAGYEHGNSLQKLSGKSEMSQSAVDVVYSDYAVDVVEKGLQSENLLKNHAKQEEGTFVKLTQDFTLLDLELMNEFWANEALPKLMNKSGDAEDIYTLRDSLSALRDLYPNTIFLKLKSSLVIGDESNFRYNKTQLQIMSLSSRKLTVLGRVESISTKNLENDDFIPDFNSNDLTQISQLMPQMQTYFLKLITGIKKDDRFIKPLALFFE